MRGVKSIVLSADLGKVILGSAIARKMIVGKMIAWKVDFANAVLRSAIVAGVIALSLANVANAKEAQEIVKAGSLGGRIMRTRETDTSAKRSPATLAPCRRACRRIVRATMSRF